MWITLLSERQLSGELLRMKDSRLPLVVMPLDFDGLVHAAGTGLADRNAHAQDVAAPGVRGLDGVPHLLVAQLAPPVPFRPFTKTEHRSIAIIQKVLWHGEESFRHWRNLF